MELKIKEIKRVIEINGTRYEVGKITPKKIRKIIGIQKEINSGEVDIDKTLEIVNEITGIPKDVLEELDLLEIKQIMEGIMGQSMGE